MKEEKVRALIIDNNNNVIEFERFACGLKTAEKNMRVLLNSPLYRIGLNDAAKIKFYSVVNNRTAELLKEKSL